MLYLITYWRMYFGERTMPTVSAAQTRATDCCYRTPAQHVASDLTRASVSAAALHSTEAPLRIPLSLTAARHDISHPAVPRQHKPERGGSFFATEIKDMDARASSDSPWAEVHRRQKRKKYETSSH